MTTPLVSLPEGTRFEIPGLEMVWKEGVVLRQSTGSVFVSIMNNEHGDGFSRKETNLACSTPVVPGERIMTRNDEGEVMLDVKTRGRRGTEMVYPDGEFTIKELAAENEMSPANAYVRLQKDLGSLVVLVRSEQRGRGKPTSIYQKK